MNKKSAATYSWFITSKKSYTLKNFPNISGRKWLSEGSLASFTDNLWIDSGGAILNSIIRWKKMKKNISLRRRNAKEREKKRNWQQQLPMIEPHIQLFWCCSHGIYCQIHPKTPVTVLCHAVNIWLSCIVTECSHHLCWTIIFTITDLVFESQEGINYHKTGQIRVYCSFSRKLKLGVTCINRMN